MMPTTWAPIETGRMGVTDGKVDRSAWFTQEAVARFYDDVAQHNQAEHPRILAMVYACHKVANALDSANATIAGLRAERDAQSESRRKDAERYRWLRNSGQVVAHYTGIGIAFAWTHNTTNKDRVELDTAIDAAIAEEPQT